MRARSGKRAVAMSRSRWIWRKSMQMQCRETPLDRSGRAGPPELEAALAERGHERFRARQIFHWIYRRGVTDVEAMTDLPRELRAALAANSPSHDARASSARERSVDGTEKFLLRLADGRADRVGVHPRHAGDDLLHLDAGRLRDGVRASASPARWAWCAI